MNRSGTIFKDKGQPTVGKDSKGVCVCVCVGGGGVVWYIKLSRAGNGASARCVDKFHTDDIIFIFVQLLNVLHKLVLPKISQLMIVTFICIIFGLLSPPGLSDWFCCTRYLSTNRTVTPGRHKHPHVWLYLRYLGVVSGYAIGCHHKCMICLRCQSGAKRISLVTAPMLWIY